jgi:hypothetical protein
MFYSCYFFITFHKKLKLDCFLKGKQLSNLFCFVFFFVDIGEQLLFESQISKQLKIKLWAIQKSMYSRAPRKINITVINVFTG